MEITSEDIQKLIAAEVENLAKEHRDDIIQRVKEKLKERESTEKAAEKKDDET